MEPITFISALVTTVILTVILVGWFKDDSTSFVGGILLILWLLLVFAFQYGASWQRDYIEERYILTEK